MKTYVFDFDGTLVDSMPYYAKATVQVLDDAGMEYPDDIVKITTPLGYTGAAELYVKMGMKDTVPNIVANMKAYALDAYTNIIPLKESVREFLQNAKAEGVKLAVLTASPHEMVDVCLKRLGVFDWFDFVWSSDDFPYTKAQPEIHPMAAERLGVTLDDITFFDDNIVALQTAKKAGLKAIGVFDESSMDYRDEIKGFVDRYIDSFKELV